MDILFKERKRQLQELKLLRKKNKTPVKKEVPEGMYTKCTSCGEMLLKEDLKSNHYVCPKCNEHLYIKARDRIELLVDTGTFKETNAKMRFRNPISFPDYATKIVQTQDKTDLNEAVLTGTAKISGMDVVLVVMDKSFLMASMGQVVGEKITKACELAYKKEYPLIIFTASGGARMQEGIISLMQMAKTSQAIAKLQEKGILYISYITHPTTGGVTASFASLGDIILAEPKALIGFAGPRVIESTIKQKLPEGFQKSEFMLENGFVDHIVERKDMKIKLTKILMMHGGTKWKK